MMKHASEAKRIVHKKPSVTRLCEKQQRRVVTTLSWTRAHPCLRCHGHSCRLLGPLLGALLPDAHLRADSTRVLATGCHGLGDRIEQLRHVCTLPTSSVSLRI